MKAVVPDRIIYGVAVVNRQAAAPQHEMNLMPKQGAWFPPSLPLRQGLVYPITQRHEVLNGVTTASKWCPASGPRLIGGKFRAMDVG